MQIRFDLTLTVGKLMQTTSDESAAVNEPRSAAQKANTLPLRHQFSLRQMIFEWNF